MNDIFFHPDKCNVTVENNESTYLDLSKEIDFDEYMNNFKIDRCVNEKLLQYLNKKKHNFETDNLLVSLVKSSADGVESYYNNNILETVGEQYKILNDGRILKEIRINRNFDIIYGFNITLADYKSRLLDNSEYIDEVILIIDDHILSNDALNYQKKVPTISLGDSEIKLYVIFKKYDLNILEITIAIGYTGIYLKDILPREQLTQAPIKYGDYQIINGKLHNINGKVHNINHYECIDKISYGIMNNKTFILSKDKPSVYNFSFIVCDLDGKEYPELLRFVKLITNGMEIITKTNTKLKKIQFKEFDKDNMLIFKTFKYSDIRFDFDFYQPLKDGQFVKVEYNYQNLDEDVIDKLLKTPYYLANMLVIDHGNINIDFMNYIHENNIKSLANLLK